MSRALRQVGRDVKLAPFVDQQYVELVAAEQHLAASQDLLEHRLGVGHRVADHRSTSAEAFCCCSAS